MTDQATVTEEVATDIFDSQPSTSYIGDENIKLDPEIDSKIIEKDQNELQYFECAACGLREKYEYFGKEPPFLKSFKLLQEAYVIEDPFLPSKSGNVLILGSHCVKCNKMVCKGTNCSIYFDDTFCINCAKKCLNGFPKAVQEKINRIIE